MLNEAMFSEQALTAAKHPANFALAAIDFEYKRPADKDMGLISVVVGLPGKQPASYWFFEPSDRESVSSEYLDRTRHERSRFVQAAMEGRHCVVMLGYNIQQAEARCFAALGVDPNLFVWRDLMLEWRWLRNGDDRYKYGKCVVNGRPTTTYPPAARVGKKATQEEIDDAAEVNERYLEGIRDNDNEHFGDLGLQEVGYTLLDCLYFFGVIDYTGYQARAAVKKRVRDGIIVAGTEAGIVDARQEIMDYNDEDVADLHALAEAITAAMLEVGSENHLCLHHGEIAVDTYSETDIRLVQYDIGEWAARLAKYANRGIPLHRGRLDRLLEIVPVLQDESKAQWNADHPETPLYRVGLPESMLAGRDTPLRKSPYNDFGYTQDADMIERLVEAFCVQSGMGNYPRTRTGKPDVSKKVIDRYASGENLLKQFQRHQGHLSALKTYSRNKDGEVEALGYIGKDDVQRPDFGPYGTQTARNGAKAKGLCFLGPHWLRVLVDPPEGKVICEVDVAAEEVFIAGSVSDDKNLKAAYLSQDVYMYYAQLTGMYPSDLPIPSEAQRSEDWFKPHKKTRNIAKTLSLSMQFGAGFKAVAAAVRDTTKDPSVSDDQGREWVNQYKETYSDYTQLSKDLRDLYQKGFSLRLSSGWRMGCDNPSALSAGNIPVQGGGSDILRVACRLCDDAGLTVIATLHDALTFICDELDKESVAEVATRCIKEASRIVLGEDGMKVGAPEFVGHGELWLHSERAQAAWARLKEHFAGTYENTLTDHR